ncbi:MAG: hypothetical protein PHR92_13020 [Lachnospiraceae bacterium]|nr:hypothetical protein [Lachnospiraceae bacterium]
MKTLYETKLEERKEALQDFFVKNEGEAFSDELKDCADTIAQTDIRMQELRQRITSGT